MKTLKIINGFVPNFEKKEFEQKDIYIENGVITEIGKIYREAKNTIDANGNIVSPGFIDIHMHEETINTNEKDPYFSAMYELKMGVTTCVAGNCGNNRQSLDLFKNYINNNGSPVNYMTFIGHNYLRNIVGVNDRYRPSNKIEIENMKKLVRDSIKQGIIGISYGIEYSPGINFEEIVSLTDAFESNKYLLSAHFREDGEKSVESIKELIKVNEITGFPMQISHIGSCSAYGYMTESLDLINKYRNLGHDIMADCYPYDAFATTIGSAVFDDGCFERWEKTPNDILLLENPYLNVRCDKKTFGEVRKEFPDMIVAAFVMKEAEVIEALKSPFVFVGSDSLFKRDKGHPRGAGSFPRVISKYVKEMGEISLIDALWKMTSGPAKRLNLLSKGNIEVGMDADITIFNYDSIKDKADFENPTLPPEGIDYVIINGEIAVKDNNLINGRLGNFINFNIN